ncbi:MAG: DUF255 domain-containing protein [Bergeyella sp.]|nr:DUF255 domain-containing protein [Bergeyella sp.]
MSKNIFFLFVFLNVFFFTRAQILDPAKFAFEIKPLDNGVYEAIISVSLEKNWHIYSKDIREDTGIPTQMKVSGDNLTLLGNFVEKGEKLENYSEVFGDSLVYYSDTVLLIQKFKVKNPEKETTVSAELTYQICNEKICLAPNTLEFEQKIEKQEPSIVSPPETNSTEKAFDPVTANNEENNIRNKQKINNSDKDTAQNLDPNSLKIPTLDHKNTLTNCGQKDKSAAEENFLSYFLLGLAGGILALLTPCVFPMVPLTVSFFTHKKGKKAALLYSVFIFIIFVSLSLPFHLVEGIAGNIFNQISTSIGLNLFFFFVFIFFAGSFFGYYDIRLPNFILNRSSKAENAGGIVGLFFMALTLVIVSFSCTGPILGSLLGSTITGSSDIPLLLTYALTGFGFSWAVIFGLLALFPQTLNKMPKSGSWMNTLKVTLGFIELALALKFLSKADLVSKTFLLKRELFIGLWILISLGLFLYLLGYIKFPYDNKKQKIGIPRKIGATVTLGIIAYLVQGLFPSQKPKLELLSGILPPFDISYYNKENQGIMGLKPIHDYFQAIKQAKKENKPVLIDFTGYGCENCRKMEENVWSTPEVFAILRDEVILASLYIDDRELLPKELQGKINMGNGQLKKVKTVGDRWSIFQQINFDNNSQPLYVLVTPDQKVINPPSAGYTSKKTFKDFLDCGIKYYNSLYRK